MRSAIVAFALSFLAFASASPLDTRKVTCRPNFGGPPGLSIINGGREWSLASSPPVVGTTIVPRNFHLNNNEFRVEFTGQADNHYLIKPVGFPELRVAASGIGKLHIATPNSADHAQEWKVLCNKCGDPGPTGVFTTGCTIRSATNNKCVQFGFPALVLRNCNGHANQLFNFGATNN